MDLMSFVMPFVAAPMRFVDAMAVRRRQRPPVEAGARDERDAPRPNGQDGHGDTVFEDPSDPFAPAGHSCPHRGGLAGPKVHKVRGDNAMFITIKTAFTLTAIAALAAVGSAASAGTFQSNGRTAEVRHGDLNLAKAADQKALRKRISLAASRVCANRDLRAMEECRSGALANVKEPVNAAIARAATGEVYADAGKDARLVIGN
jgi:UrcA family protein